jgi:hypothetical protein
MSATLSVNTTPGVAVSAGVSGTAQAVAIVPPTKDYGTVPLGSSSPATFTITNLSSAALPAPLATSVSGSGFSITSDGCNGQTLALGASCTVVVTFAPTVTGTTYNGQLKVDVILAYGIHETLTQATLVGTGASVDVVVPSNGASVSGTSSVLDAVPSGGATQVVFEVIGGSVNAMVADGTPTLYGWLATWNTTAVPDGTYTLQAQASYAGGVTVTSPGIQITVNN